VHQIRFWPGELTAFPQTPSWFKGALLPRGGERRGRKGIGEARERGGKG